MTISSIKQLFDSFQSKQILIIGDVMLDTYIWGKVNRISPEAPVPVLSVSHRDYRLGGAANVAKNIKSLGATPLLLTCIGVDDAGSKITDLLAQRSYESKAIVKTISAKTTVKMRFISQGQHIVRVDDENPELLQAAIQDELSNNFQSLLKNHTIDAIIFADYDKGVIAEKLINEVVTTSKEKNIPVLVDPKNRNFNQYKKVHFFKPNLKEFTEGLGMNSFTGNYEDLFKLCQGFLHRQSIDSVMITLSEKGVFISDGATYHHLPAVVREIADVSGAGDTVISTATLCLTAGLSLFDTALISNLAGGIVCEHPMVVPVNKKRLAEECTKNLNSFTFSA